MSVEYPDIPAAPLDLVPLALKSVSNQKLTVLIYAAGRIDENQMRQALYFLRAHFTILGYRLSSDNGWPHWRRASDTEMLTPLRVTEVGDDPQGQRAFGTYRSSEQEADAAVAVRIVRGPAEDSLYISVDHTIADAAGAKEIVYTLASYYAQLERNIRPRLSQRPPPPRDLREIRAQIGAFRKLAAVCSWRPTHGHWRFPIDVAYRQRESTYVIRRHCGQSIAQLKIYGTRYAATINDILVTAFFSALHDLHQIGPGEKLPVQFTLDLRRHLGSGRRSQVANLSSSTHVWLQKYSANPFGQTLLETHQAVAAVKRKTPGIGSALVLELIFKLGFARTRPALESIFSASRVTGLANPLFINTGVIDDQRLNFGSTAVRDACMLGPSLLVPGVAMTASGFRDRLTLSVGYGGNNQRQNYAANLLDSMIGMLSVPRRPDRVRG